MKPIQLPQFIRLKDFSKVLGKNLREVSRQVPDFVRQRKKVFCTLDGNACSFAKDSQVILPYSEASKIASQFNRTSKLQQPDTHSLSVQGCPVGVLLGHYNHGKTTILDALTQSTSFTEQEIDGTTQEIRCASVKFDSGAGNSLSSVSGVHF